MPTATWERLPEARRAAIIAAAEAEFSTNGFSKGSLNVIARNAGVSKGSLFQYFVDKSDLVTYLADLASLRIRDALEARAAELPWLDDYWGCVEDILVAWVEHYRNHPADYSTTGAVMLEHDPDLQSKAWIDVNPHYVGVIQPLIELGRALGQLREDVDAQAVTTTLIFVLPMLGLATRIVGVDPYLGLADDDPQVRAEGARRIVRLLRAGMAADRPPDRLAAPTPPADGIRPCHRPETS